MTEAERLKEFMKCMNLSRKAIGDALRIEDSAISKWKALIPDKHLRRLFEAFPDLNANWMLSGVGSMLLSEQNQNPIKNSTQELIITPPYSGECTNPRCTEKIAYLTERIEELRKDKDFLREMLQRKEVPPENKSEGGVESSRKAG